MKLLVFPHHLEIGGSQTNAIDLATKSRDDFGHEVVFAATPGPAAEVLDQRRFRLIELPRPRSMPSPTLIREFGRACRREDPDLVHAYEDQQIFDAFYGAHVAQSVPMMGTVMSMAVHRMLPRSIPLTYGTKALADAAALRQPAPVWLLEPPVNTDTDHPGAVDPGPFVAEWGLDDEAVNVVAVSRLISWLKGEGLFRAMDAVAAVARRRGGPAVRLVMVGGGPLLGRLAQRAAEVNTEAGRRLVVVTGPMLDPRPAYAAADIVLGMGGSILRGMAFAKPALVVGEGGFSAVYGPDTEAYFHQEGLYGFGRGGPADLAAQLAGLVDDPQQRQALAAFAHRSVVERYGLSASAAALDGMYRAAVARRTRPSVKAVDGSAAIFRRAAARAPESVKARLRRRSPTWS